MDKILSQQVEDVVFWAKERGILDDPNPYTQALKTVSEVGEFADNIAKGRCVKDDIGDILVTLIIQAAIQNTSLEECLDIAYNTISKRKGKLVNGVFIKEGDIK